jgi:hypothetical protein
MSGKPPIDLTGVVISHLTVVQLVAYEEGKGFYWEVRCCCGNFRVYRAALLSHMLSRGVSFSCGCKRREAIGNATRKHGLCSHPLYCTWESMKKRCRTPSADNFEHYGGRGIQVCARWESSFPSFLQDMEPSYRPGLTLERRKNDEGYNPSNCIWADGIAQANNTRKNVFIETPRGRLTIAQAAREFGLTYQVLYRRLRRSGATVDSALGL